MQTFFLVKLLLDYSFKRNEKSENGQQLTPVHVLCLVWSSIMSILIFRSSLPEVFLGKGVLKICSKFTGEHSHWSVFSLSCSATPLISQMCISQKVKVAIFRSSHPEVFFKKRCSESMQQIYRRTLMQKCDFNKVALQLYWNHTSGWVSSRSFTEYFQHTSS